MKQEEGAVLPVVLIVICAFLLLSSIMISQIPVNQKLSLAYREYFTGRLTVAGALAKAEADFTEDPAWAGTVSYEANGIKVTGNVAAQAGEERLFTLTADGTLYHTEYYGRFRIINGKAAGRQLMQKRFQTEAGVLPDW